MAAQFDLNQRAEVRLSEVKRKHQVLVRSNDNLQVLLSLAQSPGVLGNP